MAVIKAGAPTETEMKERKDLIDDALHATKAAVEEGIVPGGGVAFLRAIAAVEKAKAKAKGDEKIGFDIVIGALKSPTRQIVDNAGEDGDVVVAEMLEKERQHRLRRRQGRVRGHVQGRHHRPGQGLPVRPCRTPPPSPG